MTLDSRRAPKRPSLARAAGLAVLGFVLGAAAPALARDEGFARADRPRAFSFPADHGSHPEFQTEWWYVTGSLETPSGNPLGFQATWFRTALVADPPPRASRLAARDLVLFHGALTDVEAGRFHFEEQSSRAAAGWAGAATGDLSVRLLDHSLEREDDGWRLRCRVEDARLDLLLVPTRAPLLHGRQPGLSLKGDEPGQASYYYSQTRLRATGTLRRGDGSSAPVRGEAWFDHEFGSSQLDGGLVGWDWFSVALSDGTDLMLYRLRDAEGGAGSQSSGTLRQGETVVHLPRDAVTIDVLDTWTSPRSGATYPAAWRVRVPSRRIDLRVRPVLADQELATTASTGVHYFEGLCTYEGRAGDIAVTGRGYVELVGYAERLEGI